MQAPEDSACLQRHYSLGRALCSAWLPTERHEAKWITFCRTMMPVQGNEFAALFRW